MKRGLQWAVALALGLVAGLLTWLMLPPTPTVTLTLPDANDNEFVTPIDTWPPFTLQAVSSDARFFVTFGRHLKQKWQTINVWDRQRGLDKPFLAVPLDQPEFSGHTTLLSPDERTLAIVVWYRPKKLHDFVWFDLRTGNKIKGVQMEMDHLFFAPDGKLHYVNGDIVRDFQTGEGLRKLEPKIDGFERDESMGPFAVYRNWAQHVRVYSWLTGSLHATFATQSEWGWVWLTSDGRTMAGVAGPEGFEIVQASNIRSRFDEPTRNNSLRALSSDGEYLVIDRNVRRHPWLSKIWPVDALGRELVVMKWKTNAEVAAFRNPHTSRFSPGGNQLAVLRSDLAIDVYDFPPTTPWLWIVGSALLTGAMAWGIGWGWSRGRARRSRSGPALAPPAA